MDDLVILSVTLGLNLLFKPSNHVSLSLSTTSGIIAAPKSLKLMRGYARLNKAQKEANMITQDTEQGYQGYLNPSDEVKNVSKTINLENLDFKGKKFRTEKDINKDPEVWAKTPFDKNRFPEVHRTNFAEQAKGNILIAQDQQLSATFWDNFGMKKYRCGLNWKRLQSFRSSVEQQKALAQNDPYRPSGDHTVADKILRQQGCFDCLVEGILDPAKEADNKAKFDASQAMYEAGQYYHDKHGNPGFK